MERYTAQRDEEAKKKGSERKVKTSGDPGEGEPAEGAESSRGGASGHVADPLLSEKSEEEYQKLEREFREKMGITSEG